MTNGKIREQRSFNPDDFVQRFFKWKDDILRYQKLFSGSPEDAIEEAELLEEMRELDKELQANRSLISIDAQHRIQEEIANILELLRTRH